MKDQGSTSCVWPCQDNTVPYYYPSDQTCKSFCSQPYQADKGQYGTSCDLILSQEEQKKINTVVSLATAGNIINSISVTAATIASASNPTTVTGVTLVKLLGYTRYLDVTHSPRLEATYVQFKSSTGVLDAKQLALPVETKTKFAEKTSPSVFEKYNISPIFLVGFWIGFVSLLIISGIVLFAVTVAWGFSKTPQESTLKTISKKVKDITGNYLLQQFYNSYADIMMFAVLQFHSARFSKPLSIFSFLLAIAFLITGGYLLFLHVRLLRRYQKIKRDQGKADDKTPTKLDEFKAQHEGIKTLFADFKDDSFVHQAFLLFFVIRSIATALFLTLLFEHPLSEAILLTIMSILLLTYIMVFMPFKNVLDNLQQFGFELILLIANASVLTLARLDREDGDHTQEKYRAAETILKANVVAQYLPTIFLVLKLLVVIYETYKARMNKKAQYMSGKEEAKKTTVSDNKGVGAELKIVESSEMKSDQKETEQDLIKRNSDREDNIQFGVDTSKISLTNKNDKDPSSPVDYNTSPSTRYDNSPLLGRFSPKLNDNQTDSDNHKIIKLSEIEAERVTEHQEDKADEDLGSGDLEANKRRSVYQSYFMKNKLNIKNEIKSLKDEALERRNDKKEDLSADSP